jgi:leukotriene-A4 hydrolase
MLLIVVQTLLMIEPLARVDPHSFSNPEQLRTEHLDLDLTVDFDKKQLHGYVTHKLKTLEGQSPKELVLDTRKLNIEKCEVSTNGTDFTTVKHQLDKEVPIFGSALRIPVPEHVHSVRIHYSTSPEAAGLQWLSPAQTADKKHPFLFTQSQAINARSWIPVQDTPGVRFTYSGFVQVPGHLQPVMSADRHETKKLGLYRFEMNQRIPAYLLALAVGDIKFQAIGKRTGIWAEPSVVAKAAKEFEDMELMLEAVESLYGPYVWGRYDVLILPPSFPFGGMENPRMTFATPTVLAGDKSLVSLIAHEMAHSWSGNLVTNATWRDFWLNEGFTVYLERRILEKVYGKDRAEMEAQIGRGELEKSMKAMKPNEQILHINLDGVDPDDNVTDIPYEKGFLFLLHLEKLVGRERFDAFLKGWFAQHSFQSVTTPVFVAYLKKELLDKDPELAKAFPLEEWINKPGLPAGIPAVVSAALSSAEQQAKSFAAGTLAADKLPSKKWSTQEWLYFLRALPENLHASKLKELDDAHHLTKTGNNEVLCQWLEMAIHTKYEPAYSRLESFLIGQGRRKYVKPLFEALLKTPEGKERAKAIYAKARPGYHSITTGTIDEMMK